MDSCLNRGARYYGGDKATIQVHPMEYFIQGLKILTRVFRLYILIVIMRCDRVPQVKELKIFWKAVFSSDR